jgi:hypothetical protein
MGLSMHYTRSVERTTRKYVAVIAGFDAARGYG